MKLFSVTVTVTTDLSSDQLVALAAELSKNDAPPTTDRRALFGTMESLKDQLDAIAELQEKGRRRRAESARHLKIIEDAIMEKRQETQVSSAEATPPTEDEPLAKKIAAEMYAARNRGESDEGVFYKYADMLLPEEKIALFKEVSIECHNLRREQYAGLLSTLFAMEADLAPKSDEEAEESPEMGGCSAEPR